MPSDAFTDILFINKILKAVIDHLQHIMINAQELTGAPGSSGGHINFVDG
jgi:hypothetical protein